MEATAGGTDTCLLGQSPDKRRHEVLRRFGRRRVTRRLANTLVLVLVLCTGNEFVDAQHREAFETPETSWRLVATDCPAIRVVRHERVFRQPHRGLGCEYLHLSADLGTFVYYGHRVPAVLVVDELTVSVWVRSTRPGIQLLVRVRLPQSPRPQDGRPVETWLRGETYEQVGQWQALTLAQPLRQLRRQESALRFEFGHGLDIRGAVLDLIALNVYGGPGQTEVWVDDLEVGGAVLMVPHAEGEAEDLQHSQREPIRVENGFIFSGNQRQFMRAIEYSGESCTELARAGFDAVWLTAPPTERLLQQAQVAGLWVLAPEAQPPLIPPQTLTPWTFYTPKSSRSVNVPTDVYLPAGSSDHSSTYQPVTIGRVHHSDARLWQADVAIVELPTVGSGMELSEFGAYLHALVTQGHPRHVWGMLPSGPPQPLVQQLQARKLMTEGLWCEPEQLRLLAAYAMAAGSRGVLWRSYYRLDEGSPSARLRRAVLEWLNWEMELLEPFLAGGRAIGRVDVNNPHVDGYVLQTERADLCILIWSAAEQQFCARAPRAGPIHVTVPVRFASPRVYRLTTSGFAPVPAERVAGGVRFVLDGLDWVTYVVLTHEPVIMTHLLDRFRRFGPPRATAMLQTMRLSRELTEQTVGNRPEGIDSVTTSSNAARQPLHDPTPLRHTDQRVAINDDVLAAMQSLAATRRGSWESAVRQFPLPTSSPACSLFSSLPLHAALVGQLQQRPWSENVLPAGNMDDFPQMVRAGWQVPPHRVLPAPLVRVETARISSDRLALHLQVSQIPPPKRVPGVDEPAAEIISPEVPVSAGQMVHVRGWAYVPHHTKAATSLWIYDTIGGPMLVSQLRPSQTWIPWSLYRIAGKDGTFRVHFQLYGEGDVWLDDVTVHLLEGSIVH